MAFSGSTHNRIHDFTDDEDNNIDPSSQRFDEEFDDLSSSLESRLAKDGTNSATANIPMGGFKVTGLANGTASGDAVHVGQTATDSAAGVVEIATTAEIDTGTDTSRAITPAGLVHVLDGSSTQKVLKEAIDGTDASAGSNLIVAMRHTQTGPHTAVKRQEVTIKIGGTYSYNCIVTSSSSGTLTSYLYVNGVFVDSISVSSATTSNTQGTTALSAGDTVELWTGAATGSPNGIFYLNLGVSDDDMKARGQYVGRGVLADQISADGIEYFF